eukprot:TRINITY_DN9522_c0_g1_i1.p1 TRINITY_DN9522_c0_g1~~TRINITY_DN9522_c0_g1_i1.p1  ORF type:complete len:153 (+),score=17.86 TRINITY_DN9522_c0_g1_i1:46-504(+)
MLLLILSVLFTTLITAQNTTAPAFIGCPNNSTCSGCVEISSCVYCPESATCIPGNEFGPHNKSQDCSSWKWKQCAASGIAVWITIGVVGGVLVLVILGTLCYCMCFSGKRRASDEVDYVPFHERPSPTPKTDKNRQQFAEKYGISSQSNEKQ